jgi:hypothetical protein
MNLKPHNEVYYMIMSLHLHYLVYMIVQLPSWFTMISFLFTISSTKWSWTSFTFAWFDHTWHETNWNSMIEGPRLLYCKFWIHLESTCKDLTETLRKESIKNTREGFTNDDPYMWMADESSFLKPIRIY